MGAQVAEICWQGAQREGLGDQMSRDQFLARLASLVKQGTILFPVSKGTVLMVKPLQTGTAEIHTFTTEDGRALIKGYIKGAQTAKKMGVKHVVSYADSPAFVKLAKSTGLPVQISQTTRMQNGQMRPVYQFDLDL